MAARITLVQHLANAAAAASSRGLSAEATGRNLADAKDYWESRLNTPTGVPGA